MREINLPAAHKGAAIVDAYGDTPVMTDLNKGAERAAGKGRSAVLSYLISKCALLLSSTGEQIVLRYITDMISVRRRWLRDPVELPP
jgi:hypothetical protein